MENNKELLEATVKGLQEKIESLQTELNVKTIELRNINKGQYTKTILIPGGFLILKKEDAREINNKIDKDKEIEIIIEEKTNNQLEKFSNIFLNKLKKNIQINEI